MIRNPCEVHEPDRLIVTVIIAKNAGYQAERYLALLAKAIWVDNHGLVPVIVQSDRFERVLRSVEPGHSMLN